MKYRLLGKSGLRVSEAALGTMTFGEEFGWGSPKAEAQKVYETYREAGGNLIDTANFYTNGTSEKFVGEFIQGHRESVILGTKYSLASPGNDPNAAGNQRKSMMQAVELGITFIAAQSPQAKGRVERLWGVLQDRLCRELRLAGAGDLDSANRVLRRFLADYNRRFARSPREAAKAWRRAPEDLARVCAFRHERIVSNDNIVQCEGRRLQIPPQNRRFSLAGAKVQLYQALDGRVSLFCGDTRLQHIAVHPG